MTKRLIMYLVLLAATIYISLLYDGDTIRFLIAFEIILPVILLILLIIQKRYIDIAVKIPNGIVGKNNDVILTSCVTHKILAFQLLLPVHLISLKGKCRKPDGSDVKLSLTFESADQEKEAQNITLNGLTEHYGVIDFKIDKIKIHDYLKLFALPVSAGYEEAVYVFPQNDELTIRLSSLRSSKDILVENVAVNSLGHSQEDVNDPREYMPGDSINRVHWKLSARLDKLMVKEYSGLISSKVLLLINGINTQDRDRWIEQVFLIASALRDSLPSYDAGWLEGSEYVIYTIESMSDFTFAMQTFLRSQQDNKIESRSGGRDKSQAVSRFLERDYTTVMDFNVHGVIHINGEELTGIYE